MIDEEGEETMCGRFSLTTPLNQIQDKFNIKLEEELAPRYNIAPSQQVFTLFYDGSIRMGKMMRWGLIPSWAKDTKMGFKLINARAEGIEDKPSFKVPFKRQRCLILADGFYEWKQKGKTKQPIRFQLKDREPFAMAGIFDIWNKGEETITSCTIITTKPNELVKDVHDRMPTILTPDIYDTWLDPKVNDIEYLKSLLVSYPKDDMEAYPVTSLVNSPKNDLPELLEPISINSQLSLF